MNYSNLITAYNKELTDITDKIKMKMDLFYEENNDSDDVLSLYQKFRDTFNTDISIFDSKYNMSCPKILADTPYKLICVKNSIELYIDLNNHYNFILEKIHSRFPHLDESLQIED